MVGEYHFQTKITVCLIFFFWYIVQKLTNLIAIWKHVYFSSILVDGFQNSVPPLVDKPGFTSSAFDSSKLVVFYEISTKYCCAIGSYIWSKEGPN